MSERRSNTSGSAAGPQAAGFLLLAAARCSVWLGPDHLLSVTGHGINESYKRFTSGTSIDHHRADTNGAGLELRIRQRGGVRGAGVYAFAESAGDGERMAGDRGDHRGSVPAFDGD